MKFLIAGLGNIGADYVETRHNIGFDVVDVFAAKHQARFSSQRLADVAEVKYKGRILVLIKPTTYMNLSGNALRYWLQQEKIPIENSLTIVDDLAFPLDVMKVRASGSAAGHNGLRSIEESLGTQNYPRVRFGIGNNFARGKQVDFVLGRWKDNEIPMVNLKVKYCTEIIESFATIGLDRTMNIFNQMTYKL
jgi:peptidyl-tRNA hydrolase, PTH1 family